MPAGVPTFAKFDDDKREAYLQALRDGKHRTVASREVGVSHYLVCLYRKAHPEFAKAERLAQMEANGKVENALFQAALGGNITACQVWLYNRSSRRWKDQRNVKIGGLEDVLSRLPPELGRAVRELLAAPVPNGNGEVGPADQRQ